MCGPQASPLITTIVYYRSYVLKRKEILEYMNTFIYVNMQIHFENYIQIFSSEVLLRFNVEVGIVNPCSICV
jgi:hypothetical protein